MNLKTFENKLTQASKAKFITSAIIILFINSFLFGLINIFVENTAGPDLKFDTISHIFLAFFTASIVAPLLETLVFQHAIFNILTRIKRENKIFLFIYLILSSILFGLSHWYSVYYIILATFMGIILGYYYYISKQRNESSYWNTVMIHSIYNTTAVTLGLLLID